MEHQGIRCWLEDELGGHVGEAGGDHELTFHGQEVQSRREQLDVQLEENVVGLIDANLQEVR